MCSERLKAAYRELDGVTPLRFDCGRLCEKACCKQNAIGGEACGMWLLPHEDELYLHKPGFSVKNAGKDSKLLVCDGQCDRSLRPFACRIFPYYACLSRSHEGISVKIRPDPRSSSVCPVFWLQKEKMLRPRIDFLRAAKRAVRILLTDDEIRKELFQLSDELSEMELLASRLMKS